MGKRDAVLDGMRHSWKAYEERCWGSDECSPISGHTHNLTKEGSVGYQIVDVLDTLIVMGMDEEYEKAAGWVREELRFDLGGEFNTFEVSLLSTFTSYATPSQCLGEWSRLAR